MGVGKELQGGSVNPLAVREKPILFQPELKVEALDLLF